MKRTPKKISLHRETLRQLDADALALAAGGATGGRACSNRTCATCPTDCRKC